MRQILTPDCRWLFHLMLFLGWISITEASAQTFFGDTTIANLTPAQRKGFIHSIQEKVFYLQHYITQISDKSIPMEDRLDMIESVMKLFSNENNVVQVSNAATGKVEQYPVRLYFKRLASIKAAKVEITFYEGTRLEKLNRGTDGYYYGTALMYQDTKIYKDVEGMLITSDKTIKQVNFKSRQEYNRVGDKKEAVMETLLENINVKETLAQ